MAQAISIHVGVGRVRPPGLNAPPLVGPVNDAAAMHSLARDAAVGFEGPPPILDEDATIDRVVGEILQAARELQPGGIFLFTFAGHGATQEDFDFDETGSPGEPGPFFDETILLHDKMLLDDVLRLRLWPRFREGVRVLMVSDSCHSGNLHLGGFAPASAPASARQFPGGPRGLTRGPGPVGRVRRYLPRRIEGDIARQHLAAFEDYYKKLMQDLDPGDTTIKANVLLLAACHDREETLDGPHGVFTRALLDVWREGGVADYADFRRRIAERLPHQRPQLDSAGPRNLAFEAQRPFTVAAP